MKLEKYLPIGSVVLLKNAKKKVMVIGYLGKGTNVNDKTFDYIGCMYPLGMIDSKKNLLFNHDQIEQFFYVGYVDNEWKEVELKINTFEMSEESPKAIIEIWEEERKSKKILITSSEIILEKAENIVKLVLDFSLTQMSAFSENDDYRVYAIVNIEKWGKNFKQTEENYLIVSVDF